MDLLYHERDKGIGKPDNGVDRKINPARDNDKGHAARNNPAKVIFIKQIEEDHGGEGTGKGGPAAEALQKSTKAFYNLFMPPVFH